MVFWDFLPQVYRNKDLENNNYLEKFVETERYPFEILRDKIQRFGELRDPNIARSQYDDTQVVTLGGIITDRGTLLQRGIEGTVAFGVFKSSKARFSKVHIGKELHISGAQKAFNNRTVVISSIAQFGGVDDPTSVHTTPALEQTALGELLTWELRDKLPQDLTQVKFEVEFGDISSVVPGWYLSDGAAEFPIIEREVLAGKTLREGSNGAIPSLGAWFVIPLGSTFTFDLIGKRLSILDSSIASNNGVYEIKEIRQVTVGLITEYRAAVLTQNRVEAALIPDSALSWAILDIPKLTLGSLATRLTGIREQRGYDAHTTVSGGFVDISAPSAEFDIANQTDVGKIITVRCSESNTPSEFSAKVLLVVDLYTVRAAAPAWWVPDTTHFQEWELRTATSIVLAPTYATLVVPGSVVIDGDVTYTANYSGDPGNLIQVVQQLGALGVTVATYGSGKKITVSVGTPFPGTASAVAAAVNGTPAAAALVTATAGGDGTGIVGLTDGGAYLSGGVEATQLRVRPPSMLELLAKDFGIEIDARETEERQRNWVRHVSDWNRAKGTASAYAMMGRMTGYNVTSAPLYRISQDVADKLGIVSSDLYEVPEFAYGRSYPSPSSSTSPAQGGRLSAGTGGRIKFSSPAAAFRRSDIGRQIRINGATNPSNDKLYTIDEYVDPSTVQFRFVDTAIVPDPVLGVFTLKWAITRLYTTRANSQPRFDDMDPMEMGQLINSSHLRVPGSASPNGDVMYTAKLGGTAGDNLQIEQVAANPANAVTVTSSPPNTLISVKIGSPITSTSQAVVTAVNGDTSASALVLATVGDDGTHLAAARVVTDLSGGGDAFGVDRYCWESGFSTTISSDYFYLVSVTQPLEDVQYLEVYGPMDVVRDVAGGNWRITDQTGTDFYLDTDALPVYYSVASPPIHAHAYTFNCYSSVAPQVGPISLTYDCPEVFSCDFCKSNKVLLNIELGDLLNDPPSCLENSQTRLMNRIEQVKPAHVEILTVSIAHLSASLSLSALVVVP